MEGHLDHGIVRMLPHQSSSTIQYDTYEIVDKLFFGKKDKSNRSNIYGIFLVAFDL